GFEKGLIGFLGSEAIFRPGGKQRAHGLLLPGLIGAALGHTGCLLFNGTENEIHFRIGSIPRFSLAVKRNNGFFRALSLPKKSFGLPCTCQLCYTTQGGPVVRLFLGNRSIL